VVEPDDADDEEDLTLLKSIHTGKLVVVLIVLDNRTFLALVLLVHFRMQSADCDENQSCDVVESEVQLLVDDDVVSDVMAVVTLFDVVVPGADVPTLVRAIGHVQPITKYAIINNQLIASKLIMSAVVVVVLLTPVIGTHMLDSSMPTVKSIDDGTAVVVDPRQLLCLHILDIADIKDNCVCNCTHVFVNVLNLFVLGGQLGDLVVECHDGSLYVLLVLVHGVIVQVDAIIVSPSLIIVVIHRVLSLLD
jgi:hypothetical protein